MEQIKKKQAISLAEVKEILDKVDPESLDQIQRWTHDYSAKFVKLDPKNAKKMKQQLMKELIVFRSCHFLSGISFRG